MPRRNTSCLALAAVIATGLAALDASAADQRLNAAQVKEAFSGKTVDAINHAAGNKSQTTYFAPDGKMTQKTASGERKQGTWRVDDQGRHCVTWTGQSEACNVIVSRGDGTYQRLTGDKATVTIQQMRAGDLLDQ
jgi:hypothetical protein